MIRATAEHPFWEANRSDWSPAGLLKAGDLLRSRDSGTAAVVHAQQLFQRTGRLGVLLTGGAKAGLGLCGSAPVTFRRCPVGSEDIPGVREIRRLLPDFRPDGLRRWRGFHLKTAPLVPGSEHWATDLIVRAEYGGCPGEGYLVELTMRGVRELRLPDFREWFGFCHYAIDDVRVRQWEGIRYRVTETEEGRRFLCLCHDVAFTGLFRADPFGIDAVVWEAQDSPPHTTDR